MLLIFHSLQFKILSFILQAIVLRLLVVIFYINLVADIIERPEEATYVPGEILTQKCSARSLYPMTVTWEKSRLLFSIKDIIDSHETESLYNILNSTISIRISLLTPLSFYMWCRFYTYIYFQPDNFTKVHGLYQEGLLFEEPKVYTAIINTEYREMTIHRKSNLIVLNFNFILYRSIIYHL